MDQATTEDAKAPYPPGEEVSSKSPASTGTGLLLYRTEDGRTRIQCRLEDESLWLTQAQMAELFETTTQNITRHIKEIFAERELDPEATCKAYLQVRQEGSRSVSRTLQHYRLDVILAVGFRVRSHRGTQFRQWAIERLDEFLVKGFTMDDERLKNPPGPGHVDYFDELLERIREIRASERRFYQKVLDIYATSVDYEPKSDTSQKFFATVQNKMHFAAHGHTAAEVVHERADASKPHMGMRTTRAGGVIRKDDAAIAKNYLEAEELQVLNRIVTMYLDFAELQAMNRAQMTMQAWIDKLDEFLKLSGREVLRTAGRISAQAAKVKADREYARFRELEDAKPRAIDAEFDRVAKHLKAPPKKKRSKK